MQNKTTLRRIAVAGLLTVGALTLPATAAHASLGSCTSWYGTGETFSVNCAVTAPTGYRAMVRCYYYGKDTYTTRYGAWRYTSYQTSTAYCPTGTEAADGSVQHTVP